MRIEIVRVEDRYRLVEWETHEDGSQSIVNIYEGDPRQLGKIALDWMDPSCELVVRRVRR